VKGADKLFSKPHIGKELSLLNLPVSRKKRVDKQGFPILFIIELKRVPVLKETREKGLNTKGRDWGYTKKRQLVREA